jgi:hypothetical protein
MAQLTNLRDCVLPVPGAPQTFGVVTRFPIARVRFLATRHQLGLPVPETILYPRQRCDMEVEDPLKAFDCITKPDPRHDGSLGTLDGLHADLSAIAIHAGVPLHVRQLFETAKNLSLYSWFVYRFHPIAQLIGYASLEQALMERVAHHRGIATDAVRETLRPLMNLAATNGWLKNERFDSVRRAAHVQLRDEKTLDMIQSGQIGEEPVESPPIEEADILTRASRLDYVVRIAEAMPYIRNHIAHGRPALHGGSAATLRVIAEAINQLFDPPVSASA